MKKMKKLSAAVLSVVLALSLAACQAKPSAEEEQKNFDAFLEKEFIQTMESDYTAMHIYLQNPSDFGVDINKVEVGLGSRPDEESMEESRETFENSLSEFRKFNRELLTDEQKETYDIYSYQSELNEKLNDEKFDYYPSLFESMAGIHYQLPTMLADWDLRSEQDVKDLIIMVKDTQPYVSAALNYTKKQEEKGLLMLDLQSVIDYCSGILEQGEYSSILTSMYENIDALSLSSEAAADYKEELRRAFTESFLPAYEDIKNVMEEFLNSGSNNEEGLAKFEHGKEYYELLLQQNTGSNKTVEEIRGIMEDAYTTHLQNLILLIQKKSDLFSKEPQTGYSSYEDMLDDIQQRMFEDFPEVSELSYHIKEINEEIASSSGVAAYFNVPPLDGSSVRQLRVNPKLGDISSVATYSTVAHEGFPGHMYQYAYMYENLSSPFRKALVNTPAYTEGYAVYAQFEAMKYLDGVDQDYLKAYMENELISYYAIILADIGIHYDGWSTEEFGEFMSNAGFMFETDNAVKAQYLQLQANPCASQPYYVGYYEISALKSFAEEKLGNSFDSKSFNEAILKSGNAPFSVVEKNVDAYIAAQRPAA